MAAIVAIYARENGAGTMFEEEDFYIEQVDNMLNEIQLEHSSTPQGDEPEEKTVPKKDRSFLKVIK